MLKMMVILALYIWNATAQITMEATIVKSSATAYYIEYTNNKRDGYFLETGELRGKWLRVFIKNIPPKAEWTVYFTRNLSEPSRPIGISPFKTANLVYFDLPLRATNYFFSVKYIVH